MREELDHARHLHFKEAMRASALEETASVLVKAYMQAHEKPEKGAEGLGLLLRNELLGFDYDSTRGRTILNCVVGAMADWVWNVPGDAGVFGAGELEDDAHSALAGLARGNGTTPDGILMRLSDATRDLMLNGPVRQ